MNHVTPVGVAALLLAAVACAGPQTRAEGEAAVRAVPISFTSIARGANSGIKESREIVVESTRDWQALFTRHAPGTPPPLVDFAVDVVVGVFAGERPTGGYEVDILAVERHQAQTTVVYQVTAPPRDAIVITVLTSPFHLARLPRQDRPIRFQRR
jgi:hypothetical protein